MKNYKKELSFIMYVYLFILIGAITLSPLYTFAYSGCIHYLWFLLLSIPIGGICIIKTVDYVYKKEIKPEL